MGKTALSDINKILAFFGQMHHKQLKLEFFFPKTSGDVSGNIYPFCVDLAFKLANRLKGNLMLYCGQFGPNKIATHMVDKYNFEKLCTVFSTGKHNKNVQNKKSKKKINQLISFIFENSINYKYTTFIFLESSRTSINKYSHRMFTTSDGSAVNKNCSVP